MGGRQDRRTEDRETGLHELAAALRRGCVSRKQFLRRAVLSVTGGALLGSSGVACAQEETTSRETEAVATGPESGSENPRFGYVLSHELYPTSELAQNAVLAEQAGFDMVWASDHFQPWQDNEGHSTFPWVTLALVGERTGKILFGPGVCCPIYRYQPAVVAQMYASLGQLNPGRVFVGLGAGEARNEKAATGSFGPYQERHDRLAEAVELIRELWTGEHVSYDGSFYQTDNARLYDLPDENPPIYIAASGPKSARLAGSHGDGWIMRAPDIQRQDLLDAFREGAEETGKDPDEMPKLVTTSAVYGDQDEAEYAADLWRYSADSWDSDLLYEPDPREIQRKAEEKFSLEDVYGNWAYGEDPEEHAKKMQDLLDAGATRVFVQSPQRDQQSFIDFYGSEVLPLLRSS